MALDVDLIKKFVEVTNDTNTSKETSNNIYGTAKVTDTGIYVQLDGSDILTPVSMATDAKDGDRVLVTIENHKARISSNITSPASGRGATDLYSETIDESGNLVVSGELRAAKEYVDTLIADNVTTGSLKASVAYIDALTANDITAESIKANEADIKSLKTDKADVKDLEANYAHITKGVIDNATIDQAKVNNLNANYAHITEGVIDNANIDQANVKNLNANYAHISDGVIDNAQIDHANVKDLGTTYATIDFANINQAAVEKLFSDSGIIKNLIVSEGKITGELVGVTIKGDLIEANSLKADKLVVLGEDGLYYKLNVNSLGEATASSDPKYQTGLDGSAIVANSITAEKVAVDDLVAFDASVGGFKITENSIYSGTKSSVDNTTRGIYLDNTGQFSFGEGTNFITYYKSTDGTYKLVISADSIRLGSGIVLNDVADEAKAAYNKAVTANNTANSAKDAVDNMEIGGRNLARNTSDEWSDWVTPKANSLNVTASSGSIIYFPSEIKIGDEFYIQCEVEFDNVTPSDGERSYFALQGSVDGKWEAGKFNPWNEYLYDIKNGIVTFSKKITSSVEPTPVEVYANCDFRVDYWATGRYRWRRIKVVKGNKATDWTPAPEDMATNEDLNGTIKDVNDINGTLEQIGTDISDLNDNLGSLDEKTNQLSTTITDKIAEWDYDKEQTTLAIEGVKETADDLKEKIEARFRFGMDDNGNALIGLGSSESAFTADFTNEELSFSENNVKVAWINGHTLFIDAAEIKNAKIEQDLRFGGYAFVNRSNGNLSLKWVGDN